MKRVVFLLVACCRFAAADAPQQSASRPAEPPRPSPEPASSFGPPLEADPIRLCGAVTRTADEALDRRRRVEGDYDLAKQDTAVRQRRVVELQAALDRARRNPKKWDVDSVTVDLQEGEAALRSTQTIERSVKAGLDGLRAKADPLVRRKQDCLAEANRRRAERLASVVARPIDEIRAIPAEYQLPEERERLAIVAAAEARARRERVARKLKDPKIMRVVYSAVLCNDQVERKAATDEIAAEKKYARQGGGVVDNRKLYTLQQKQRTIDEGAAKNREDLRALRVAPLGCRDRLVAKLAACIATHSVYRISPELADRVGVSFDGSVGTQTVTWGDECKDASISEHFEVIE